jgi:flavin-dependent dehydrogenase
MCYLARRDDLRKYGSLPALEENVILKNPYLKRHFSSADFLLDRPEVINEISFEKKLPVEDHVLMSGDTAGMIAPLCGNGMTMAIHSAKLLSAAVIKYYEPGKLSMQQRLLLERSYTETWNRQFARRLWVGRQLQRMFGKDSTTTTMLNVLNKLPAVTDFLISKTHGKPFS